METGNVNPSSKMEDYEIIEQIGRDSFSATFLVLHRTENKKYVLKKINISKQTEKFKRTSYQELNIIAELRHPYILEYKNAWVDGGDSICLVTSYCEHGNMLQIMRRTRGAYFPEEIVCKWLTQMLLAIEFLHSNRVPHGDLKLSNVFVTKENDIGLGDFGLSKLLNDGDLSSSVMGNPNYVFPELLAGAPYGYKSDIWSLGCCVFEIAAHQQAFKASDMAGLVNKINRSLISPLPIIYSPTLKQIIKSMLRKSMGHRPSAAELLRHSHLQPFLLRCHSPSPSFLPVKSPSPKSAKKVKISPPSSRRLREVKAEPKELLPLFDESKDTQLPSLLEGNISFNDIAETKRVDRSSYSGKISTDSEDSQSAGNADDDTNITCSSSVKQSGDLSPAEITSSENAPDPQCSIDSRNDIEMKKEDAAMIEEQEQRPVSSIESLVSKCVSDTTNRSCDEALSNQVNNNANEEVTRLQQSAKLLSYEAVSVNGNEENKSESVPQRADALESLLELCAKLLKQDKLDELNGILKPFGNETVSSRETAIWLTKSLMNAKKMAGDQ